MAHIKIYIVSIHYLYRDLRGNYTTGDSHYSTPYLFSNRKNAKSFISRIKERWEKDGFSCANEPTDLDEKLSNFHKCIWEFLNIMEENKRVIILDPTLTD